MQHSADELRSHYDAIPYPGGAFWPSHPDHLRTVAALSGLASPPVTRCRVLEIGCAIGRNLIPMASALPGSTFLGIDLSPRQIETGLSLVRQLGLNNIELRCQDLMDLPAGEGPFDYIIAHGIFSWVPAPVQKRILEVCGRQLARNGAAYISYNTLPGWRLHQAIRDMAMFHSGEHPDPSVRVAKAREIMSFATSDSPAWGPYKNLLNAVSGSWKDAHDWYLAADVVAPVNQPFYFTEFIREITAHGLLYVGDADPGLDSAHALPPTAQQQLLGFASSDEVRRQQYLDFLDGRTFRASILRRADAPHITVGGPQPPELYVAGRITEELATDPATGAAVSRFSSASATFKLNLNDPGMIAAFRRVRDAWPHAVALSELADITTARSGTPGATRSSVGTELAQAILMSFKSKILELLTRPTDFLAKTFDRPRATALARHQVKAMQPLINLRHAQVPINEAIKGMLPLLDGTRDLAALLSEFTRLIAGGELKLNKVEGFVTVKDDLPAILDEVLEEFSSKCLLASS